MVMASKTFFNNEEIAKNTKYHKTRKEHNKISHLVCSTPTHTIHKKIAFEESNNLGSPISKNIRKSEFTNTEYAAFSPFPFKTKLPVKRMKVYISDDDSNTLLQEANIKAKKKIAQKVEEEKIKTDNNNISDSPSKNNNSTGRKSSKNDSIINFDDENKNPKQTVTLENNKNKKNSSNKTKTASVTNFKRLRDQDSEEDIGILTKTNLKSNKKIKQIISTEYDIESNVSDDYIFSDKNMKEIRKKTDKNIITEQVPIVDNISSDDSSIPRTTRTHKSISKSMNKSTISQWIDESKHYDSDDDVFSRNMSLKSRKKSKQNTEKAIVNKDDDDNAIKNPQTILKNSQENTEKPISYTDKKKMTNIRKSSRAPKPREAFWKKNYTLSYNLDKNTNAILPENIKQNIITSNNSHEKNTKQINKKSNKNTDTQKLLLNIEIENVSPVSDSNQNTTNNNKSKKILPNKSESTKGNKTSNLSVISKNKKLNTLQKSEKISSNKENEVKNQENVNEKISKKKNAYSTENKKNENNLSQQNVDDKIKIDKGKAKNHSYLEKQTGKSKKLIEKSEKISPNNKENGDENQENVNENISKKKNLCSTENKKNEIKNNSSHQNIDDKIKIDRKKAKNNSFLKKPINKSKKLIDMQNKKTKNLQSNKVEELILTIPDNNNKIISMDTSDNEENENSELNAKNSNHPNKKLSSASDKLCTSNDNKNSKTTKSAVKRNRNNKEMRKLEINMDNFKKSDLQFETSFVTPDESDDTDNSSTNIPVRKSKFVAKSQKIRKVTGNKPIKRTKYKPLSEFGNNSLSSNKPVRVQMNNSSNESTSDSDSLRNVTNKNVRKYSKKSKINNHCLKFKEKALNEQLPIPRKQGLANIMLEGHPVLLECFGHFPQEIFKTREQPHLSIGKCFENDFCTVGIMEIQPQHIKNWVCALRNHIYFIILDGIAEVGIENMSRIMRIGDNFFVPKKSYYYIANIDTEKKLLINFVKIKCDLD